MVTVEPNELVELAKRSTLPIAKAALACREEFDRQHGADPYRHDG